MNVHVKLTPLPKPVALTPPKSPKVPKIAAIKIKPVGGGFHVSHAMRSGKSKDFVFQSPAKMVTHLKRLEQTAWLRPMNDIAPRTAAITDIGMTP